MGNCCRKGGKKGPSVYQPVKNQPKELKPQYDMEARKLMAVDVIQRSARRAKALKVAQAENQWKMFADLDTQDEAEMLHLAVFMQTLLDYVPGVDKFEQSDLKEAVEVDDEGNPKSNLDDQKEDGDFIIKLDSIALNETVSHKTAKTVDINDFDITHSTFDTELAISIVDVYRKGGKLNRKSVVKILRRAYKMLQAQPNTTYVTVKDNCKLTVVGDLHGQLTDLLHILDESGYPSSTNKFVFNGDFVDRGDKGLEIVCILLAFYVAEGGENVVLNRGNHEDLPVCRVYGFENEVKEKYDELLFEMFAEVFSYLPLFAVVNQSIFIVHGGLFHTPKVTLAELDEITRNDYYVKPPIPYPQNIKGATPAEARLEYLKQLQRDAMWSDPTEEEGCYLNPRGAGVSFGPDIAHAFMRNNGLNMVVRSHECAYRGYDLPFATSILKNKDYYNVLTDLTNPPECPLLCTLFSASNYIDGDNEGAYLIYLNHAFQGSVPVAEGKCELHYTVRRYKTTVATTNIADNNKLSLTELIMKKKPALSSAFEAIDTENLGVVSRIEWAEVMQRITQIKIRWLSIITTIATPECLSNTSVAYRIFLEDFSVERKKQHDDDTDRSVWRRILLNS